jgi:hypothetical protein
VLLVGEGHYDPKNYAGSSPENYIPAFLKTIDPWLGETAADNRFVTLDGGDRLPDMLIGRLPVADESQLSIVVDKLVAYQINPPSGDWGDKVMFITDNVPDPDGAGDFQAEAAWIINQYIKPPYSANWIQLTNNTLENVRTDMLDGFNEGRGILMYNGHASVHQWAVERILHVDDVVTLSNDVHPVVLEMTCFTGSFHWPWLTSLDVTMLRQPNGGASAVWGATGLGLATGHRSLSSGFFSSLVNQNNDVVGSATLAGKVQLAADHPEYLDLVDTFTLFGDPAMRLNISGASFAYELFLPVVFK